MAITTILPLAAGNAIRLFFTPPEGAKYWRVLRAGSDVFTGPEDLDYAVMVYEGDRSVIVDTESLINEVMAFYKVYYRMEDDTWLADAPVVSATPSGAYEEYTTDAMSFLRDRLERGLKIEVERGNIMHELGYVQVVTGPTPIQSTVFPVVTLTLDNEGPGERGIGEDVMGDEFDVIGDSWFDSEGWLSGVQITIVAWSQNHNERIEIRKAVRRVIVANLPVFEEKGISQVVLTAQDVDAVNGEYPVPIYQTLFTFSCIAPVRVGDRPGTVHNVEVVYPDG